MAWQRAVRRFGGLLSVLALVGVALALVLYGLDWVPRRAVQLGVGSLIVGIVGSMLLLLTADTLPPGGPPSAP